ncbi:ras gtpase-activating protein [Anaeramoeba flamelloides]|uniref:Ras gtpase-activating protein n=1 Tax=Anaeramoeba flamelloides TaxID=1746091 RepID=A0ABQ8X2G4_9EUKA|nr:ras gtpase-activating protein [Anaeramoeba flamelloides]
MTTQQNQKTDQKILEWVNNKLQKAGHSITITNFTTNFQDLQIFWLILDQILPNQFLYQKVLKLKFDSQCYEFISILTKNNYPFPLPTVFSLTHLSPDFVVTLLLRLSEWKPQISNSELESMAKSYSSLDLPIDFLLTPRRPQAKMGFESESFDLNLLKIKKIICQKPKIELRNYNRNKFYTHLKKRIEKKKKLGLNSINSLNIYEQQYNDMILKSENELNKEISSLKKENKAKINELKLQLDEIENKKHEEELESYINKCKKIINNNKELNFQEKIQFEQNYDQNRKKVQLSTNYLTELKLLLEKKNNISEIYLQINNNNSSNNNTNTNNNDDNNNTTTNSDSHSSNSQYYYFEENEKQNYNQNHKKIQNQKDLEKEKEQEQEKEKEQEMENEKELWEYQSKKLLKYQKLHDELLLKAETEAEKICLSKFPNMKESVIFNISQIQEKLFRKFISINSNQLNSSIRLINFQKRKDFPNIESSGSSNSEPEDEIEDEDLNRLPKSFNEKKKIFRPGWQSPRFAPRSSWGARHKKNTNIISLPKRYTKKIMKNNQQILDIQLKKISKQSFLSYESLNTPKELKWKDYSIINFPRHILKKKILYKKKKHNTGKEKNQKKNLVSQLKNLNFKNKIINRKKKQIKKLKKLIKKKNNIVIQRQLKICKRYSFTNNKNYLNRTKYPHEHYLSLFTKEQFERTKLDKLIILNNELFIKFHELIKTIIIIFLWVLKISEIIPEFRRRSIKHKLEQIRLSPRKISKLRLLHRSLSVDLSWEIVQQEYFEENQQGGNQITDINEHKQIIKKNPKQDLNLFLMQLSHWINKKLSHFKSNRLIIPQLDFVFNNPSLSLNSSIYIKEIIQDLLKKIPIKKSMDSNIIINKIILLINSSNKNNNSNSFKNKTKKIKNTNNESILDKAKLNVSIFSFKYVFKKHLINILLQLLTKKKLINDPTSKFVIFRIKKILEELILPIIPNNLNKSSTFQITYKLNQILTILKIKNSERITNNCINYTIKCSISYIVNQIIEINLSKKINLLIKKKLKTHNYEMKKMIRTQKRKKKKKRKQSTNNEKGSRKEEEKEDKGGKEDKQEDKKGKEEDEENEKHMESKQLNDYYLQCFDDLNCLINKKEIQLLTLMFEQFISKENINPLCNSFYNFFSRVECIIPFIKAAINQEILRIKDPKYLFKSTNFSNKLLIKFLKVNGTKYLQKTFKLIIFEICTCGIQFEIDPYIIGESQVKKNLINLQTYFYKLYEIIINSISNMPNWLLYFANLIYSQVKTKFYGKQLYSVGSFIFLRYICPAIVSPQNFQIIDFTPNEEAQRGLILLSSLIQSLSTNTLFNQNRQYMIPFNPLIEQRMKQFNNFLLTISTLIYKNKNKVLLIQQSHYNNNFNNFNDQFYFNVDNTISDDDHVNENDNAQDKKNNDNDNGDNNDNNNNNHNDNDSDSDNDYENDNDNDNNKLQIQKNLKYKLFTSRFLIALQEIFQNPSSAYVTKFGKLYLKDFYKNYFKFSIEIFDLNITFQRIREGTYYMLNRNNKKEYEIIKNTEINDQKNNKNIFQNSKLNQGNLPVLIPDPKRKRRGMSLKIITNSKMINNENNYRDLQKIWQEKNKLKTLLKNNCIFVKGTNKKIQKSCYFVLKKVDIAIFNQKPSNKIDYPIEIIALNKKTLFDFDLDFNKSKDYYWLSILQNDVSQQQYYLGFKKKKMIKKLTKAIKKLNF